MVTEFMEPATGPPKATDARGPGCPNCGGVVMSFDEKRGELVCSRCGFVVEEGLIDPGPDWRNEEGIDRARAGPPNTVQLADGGIGGTFRPGRRDASGRPLSASEAAQFGRLSRTNRWSRYSNLERALAPALALMTALTSRMGLPRSFRDRAAVILRKAVRAGLTRGRSLDVIVAGAVLWATRELGAPRGIHEVAREGGVTIHRLAAVTKLMARTLGLQAHPARAQDFIPRFASELELPSPVAERALSIIAGAPWLTTNTSSPQGVAAGALYLAAEQAGVRITQSRVARISGASEVTLRKHYQLFRAPPGAPGAR